MSSRSVTTFSSDTLFAMDDVDPTQEADCPDLKSELDTWMQAVRETDHDTPADELAAKLECAAHRVMDCARREDHDLDLSNLGLPNLPPVLGTFSHVKTLNLANNRLTDYPPQLDEMSHLRHLDLSGNHISSNGEDLCLSNRLYEINLNGNPITRLPESILGLIRRGTRVSCHDTDISVEEQDLIAAELGEKFPEDLFQRAWQAMSWSARNAVMSRNSSENWDPSLHRQPPPSWS